MVLLLVLVIGAGLAMVYIGSRAPSLTEFFERPGCWVFGHPAPGSPLCWEQTEPDGQAAEVWRCVRCGHLVKLIGPYRKGVSEWTNP